MNARSVTSARTVAIAAATCAFLAGCPREPDRDATDTGRDAPPSAQPRSLWRSDPAAVVEAQEDPVLARIKALAARQSAPPAAPPAAEPRAADVLDLPPVELPDRPSLVRLPDEPPPTFHLGPGDEIDIAVRGQPEFSGEVRVREDGSVALPTTGDLVPAAGATPAELADSVAGAIWPAYAKKRPAVSVALKKSPRLAYYVFGAVRSPGKYAMPPTGITVLDAVMRASSAERVSADGQTILSFEPDRAARYDRVYLVGPGHGGETATVDVAATMRGAETTRRLVPPGYIVVVPSSTGEWSESELRKRLAAPRELLGAGATGGTP
jgi:protein involved in polysaccharide export with SLBB domain